MTWTQEEPGWWTCERGGVCKERTGKWHAYPRGKVETIPSPWGFKTLKAAKAFVEGA